MKIAVVTPPWLHPTCPALGPAYLSAFLKRYAPKAEIRVFDLNMAYYELALKALENGTFGLKLYRWDQDKTFQMVRAAFDYLKENRLSQVDPSTWHENATIFLSFENIFNGFMAEMASRDLLDLKIPQPVYHFFQRLLDNVIDFGPDICAISIFFDAQMPFALKVAKSIKQETDSFVVAGGARFGTCPEPERLFKKGLTIKAKAQEKRLNNLWFIDGIIPGEGEIPLLALLENLPSMALENVPGIIFKRADKVMTNPSPPPLLPKLIPTPDFSDLDLSSYMTPSVVLPYLTSRGCAWGKCTFCTHHRIYRTYRNISTKRVVKQIKELKRRYGARHFSFFDEMIPPSRLKSLTKKLNSENLAIRFGLYAKPTASFNYNLCKDLFDTGARCVLFGVESGSQKILDLMNKGTTVETIEKVLKNSSRAGLRNLAFIMFGFPGETKEDFLETISFLERNKNDIHALSKGLFMLLEGSLIQREPERFFIKGMQPASENWACANTYEFETEIGLRRHEVRTLYKKNLPFLESIGISPRLGVYREHLLF